MARTINKVLFSCKLTSDAELPDGDVTAVIEVTGNNERYFAHAPVVTGVIDVNGEPVTETLGTLNISEDKHTASAELYISGAYRDITVEGYGVPNVNSPLYDIDVSGLVHCKCVSRTKDIPSDQIWSLEVKVVADDGYTFFGGSYLVVFKYDYSSGSHTVYLSNPVISDDGKYIEYSKTNSMEKGSGNARLTGTAYLADVPVNTESLVNCYISKGDPIQVRPVSTYFDIKLQAVDGCHMGEMPKIYYTKYNDGKRYSKTFGSISTDKTYALLNTRFQDPVYNVKITYTADGEPVAPEPLRTVDTSNLVNCVCTSRTADIPDGAVNLTVTLEAEQGFKFKAGSQSSGYEYQLEDESVPRLTYQVKTSSGINANKLFVALPLTAGGTKATKKIAVGSNWVNLTVNGVATSKFAEKYGGINIYNVTVDEIDQFSSKRFIRDLDTGTVDLGIYVVSLKRVFVSLGKVSDSVIVVGGENLHIATKALTQDVYTVDFGNVQIPHKNEDITDFGGKVSIFLPFVGFVDLNNAFIGKTVNLTYEVNAVTGEGVAKLSCDGNVFAIKPCEPSTEIKYKTTDQAAMLGSDKFSDQYLYGLTPYVLIYWNKSKNEKYINNDCIRTVIGEYAGFAKFNELTDINSGQITAEEKNMIIRTLSNGVYIEPQDEQTDENQD